MEADTYYHIYNRANGFENLFQTPENYRYFIQQWIKFISPVAETHAYCLMPNHFHFLIKTHDDDVLRMNFQGDKILESLKLSKSLAPFD